MRMRLAAFAALLILGAQVLPVCAEERKPATAVPTVIIRLKSLDGLIADARYIVELAGKEEEAKQGEAFLKQITGPKGLEGVDTKKPIGFYGRLGPNGVDSDVVVMVPIADEETALEFIKRFTKPEKGDDGVYTVNIAQSPLPLYFRFANGYIYVTIRDKDVIDPAKLLKPGDVLAPEKVGTISATINLDQIPKQMKQMVLGQIELQAATDKESERPGETKAQQAFRAAIIDEGTVFLKQLLNEGGPVDLRFDIDRKAAELSFTSNLAGLPDTKLQEEIAALGKDKSVVAGLVGSDSAINFLVHVALPAKLRKLLEPVIEEGFEKALKKAGDDKKKVMELARKAITPTLKAAELDAAVTFRGPNAGGKFAFVMGTKVRDGAGIEKAAKASIEDLPDGEKSKAKIDFAKVGDTNIHQVPAEGIDAKMKAALGDEPGYIAIRDDAILVSLGEKGLEAIKEAIGADSKVGPIFQFQMSVNRFARIMDADQPGTLAAAKKAFAKEPEADKMGAILTGGKSLTMKFGMSAQLVRFFTLLDETKKATKTGGDDN